MALTIEPLPSKNALVNRDGFMTAPFQRWFELALVARVQQSGPTVIHVSLADQAASIGVTALVPSASGLYRVSWYVRVVRPGTVSSSIEVAVLSTDGGVAITQTDAAVTGNTTDSVQSRVRLVRCDPGTPLSYTTTYASAGATTMLYDLELVVEALP